ncbi:MAG: bile acid:sodium symporter [Deltaproteobacteria bacterium]|jgi:ACR3 family arsenite efflux pump ArsB|nr:bile acid:sodium symporter [Deltaproteobacteria bacterium]
MKFLDKIEPLLLLSAVAAGLALGASSAARSLSGAFVSPFLTFMLLGLFWEVPLKDISKSFQNVKFTFTSFCVNFIWTPFFAWLLSKVFLGSESALALGFILLMVTPCTDWYLVFTGMAKGNLNLSVALLPFNLVVQVILLPVYILILGGSAGWTDPFLLLKSVILVLLAPFLAAKLVKRLLRNKERERGLMETLFAKRQFFWLWMAICAMFASEKIIDKNNLPVFLLLLIPVVFFFTATFILSKNIGRVLNFDSPDTVSLIFTTLARNSPLALAFAQKAFPGESRILLPLIIGPLVELPILALTAQMIIMAARKKSATEPTVS